MGNGFGALREGYPNKRTVHGSCVRIGTVTATTLFSTVLVVRIMLENEDGVKEPTEVDCRAIFTPQTEYWRRQYTLDTSYTDRFAANAYCIDDRVITVEWMGEYLVVGQYFDSPGYEAQKLPYLWPVFDNGIITGFKNTTFDDGTDFPYFSDENGANVQPINAYTALDGSSRPAGSGTGVVNPWGVLTPYEDGYIFHRQYEFCRGDTRIVLEPYDEARVFRGGGIEVGVNQAGTKLLLNGIPFAVITDPNVSIQYINVLSLNPLIVGTVESYDAAGSQYTYYIVGRVTLYTLEDICYRELVRGLVDPLPEWPPPGSTQTYLLYHCETAGMNRLSWVPGMIPTSYRRFSIFPGGYMVRSAERDNSYVFRPTYIWFTFNPEEMSFMESFTYENQFLSPSKVLT